MVVGTLAYIALVVALRLSGKRTLSKLNAFDLIVTVALGSTLATVIIDKNVSLAEGVLALTLLISLQFLIAWLSVRSSRFRNIVTSDPTLLMHRGQYLHARLKQERIGSEDLLAAIRNNGIKDVAACSVVLEADGTLSVIHVGQKDISMPRRSSVPD